MNPEELSLVNKGYRGSGRYLVPDTEGKNWRSAGTDPTVKCDNFHLASLEIDLFHDLKASFDNSTKTSNATNSSSKIRGGNCLEGIHTHCEYY